jgi:hypothetical protein
LYRSIPSDTIVVIAHYDKAVTKLQRIAAAHPELLKKEYRAKVESGAHPLTGHCYVVCEALAFLYPTLKPSHVHHGGGVHWFLRDEDGTVVDPTVAQFESPPDYSKGRPCGFLTTLPSARCASLLAVVWSE